MSNNANHFRGWQLVEEDIYEGWTSGNPGAVDERRTHVRGFWGARYIDDLMQTLVDGNADGDYVDTSGDDQYFFFLADAQFSVTAVLDGNANLQERVVYDAYGEANHHDWRDTDGDGDYDATDRSTINTLASASPSGTPITNASYEPDADLDRDGDVDSTDLSLGGTTYPTPLNKGELSLAAVDTTATASTQKQNSTPSATATTIPSSDDGSNEIRRGMWMGGICINMLAARP